MNIFMLSFLGNSIVLGIINERQGRILLEITFGVPSRLLVEIRWLERDDKLKSFRFSMREPLSARVSNPDKLKVRCSEQPPHLQKRIV